MSLLEKTQPVPQVVVPKLSKIELAAEVGVMYVIVDGETKLAMPAGQFIEFFQYALKRAYQVQNMLNAEQSKKGDPTEYYKTGGANLTRALAENLGRK